MAGRKPAQKSDIHDSASQAPARVRSKVIKKFATPQSAVSIEHRNDAIIDFNRSRVKKATSATSKPSLVIKPKKLHIPEVESQSERDTFARNFRILRKQAGLSQRDIQKLTGIAQSHVSEIESAMHNICIETMVKLAKLVKRPIHELLKT